MTGEASGQSAIGSLADRFATRIATGEKFSCVVSAAGGVSCWGRNDHAELGNGTRTDVEALPTRVVGLSDVVTIGAGVRHACALDARGDVWCWGQIEPMPDGNPPIALSPIRVGSGVRELAVGGRHTCVLVADGARCFGWGDEGELGNGRTMPSANFSEVAGLGGRPLSISAGGSHTCAIVTGGRVQCWGSGRYGRLGFGGAQVNAMSILPVDVAGWTGEAVRIAAGGDRTCALLRDGHVRCWGRLTPGRELAEEGPTYSMATPFDVPGLTHARTVTAGRAHACALLEAGTVSCWGWNEKGQLGDGTLTDREQPMRIAGLDDIVSVAAGELHTCARRRDGAAFCWGAGRMGQLGDGATNDRSLPVRVRL